MELFLAHILRVSKLVINCMISMTLNIAAHTHAENQLLPYQEEGETGSICLTDRVRSTCRASAARCCQLQHYSQPVTASW